MLSLDVNSDLQDMNVTSTGYWAGHRGPVVTVLHSYYDVLLHRKMKEMKAAHQPGSQKAKITLRYTFKH